MTKMSVNDAMKRDLILRNSKYGNNGIRSKIQDVRMEALEGQLKQRRTYHGRQNIRQGTRQLKHDNHDRYCNTHYTAGFEFRFRVKSEKVRCDKNVYDICKRRKIMRQRQKKDHREAYLKAAAAPRKAYVPGVIQLGTFGSQ
jgi:hypothetical protein